MAESTFTGVFSPKSAIETNARSDISKEIRSDQTLLFVDVYHYI